MGDGNIELRTSKGTGMFVESRSDFTVALPFLYQNWARVGISRAKADRFLYDFRFSKIGPKAEGENRDFLSANHTNRHESSDKAESRKRKRLKEKSIARRQKRYSDCEIPEKIMPEEPATNPGCCINTTILV